MQKITGLSYPPLFTPIVGNFYKGMVVSIPLVSRLLLKSVSAGDIRNILDEYFAQEPFVNVMPLNGDSFLEEGFFVPEGCNDTNRIDIFVCGSKDQTLLLTRFDNLGKGASGAAIQNMNLMLGMDETTGLKA
jgi:N-acetyl-gamma-glutamyl-phosphate reductase